ncbi:MAG TPA: hypothetical protein VGT61_15485 [Thermomicrobiales bacterium]|nr:hypothetical protein [Thermomicrobiales bacterium]
MRDPWDLASGFLRNLVVMGIIWWLFFRTRDNSLQRGAEPYFHPVLGLWFGIPAAIAAYSSGSSPVRAVSIGLLLGLTWAALMVISRWQRTRNDRPGTRRPVPTITGWREQSKKL